VRLANRRVRLSESSTTMTGWRSAALIVSSARLTFSRTSPAGRWRSTPARVDVISRDRSPPAIQKLAAARAARRPHAARKGPPLSRRSQDRVTLAVGQRAGSLRVAHDALDQMRGEAPHVEHDLRARSACLPALDRALQADPLRAACGAHDATLAPLATAIIARHVVGGHVHVQRAAVERVCVEELIEGWVCSCWVSDHKAARGSAAPAGLVVLQRLKQPGGLRLVHQLAGALAAGAYLAEQPRVRGRGRTVHGEILDQRPRERSRRGRRLFGECLGHQVRRRATCGDAEQLSRVATTGGDRRLDL